MAQLSLEQPIQASPGEEHTFVSNSGWTQYHFQLKGGGKNAVIGIWGPNNPSLGKARNQPGKNYVDRTLPKGTYRVTVSAEGPYGLVVTKNSWWSKVFG